MDPIDLVIGFSACISMIALLSPSVVATSMKITESRRLQILWKNLVFSIMR